jgi:hypothetical protein
MSAGRLRVVVLMTELFVGCQVGVGRVGEPVVGPTKICAGESTGVFSTGVTVRDGATVSLQSG